MAKLTNTDVHSILANLISEHLGEAVTTETTDLSTMINMAKSTPGDVQEQLLGSLIVHIAKRVYLDRALTRKNSPFWFDEEEFGAILEAISIELPELSTNSAMKSFTSGSTTVGEYTIVLPTVKSSYFIGTTSWGLPMTFKTDQLKSAMDSESDLVSFVNKVRVAIENKIALAELESANANRNSYIAHKINNLSASDYAGIQVVDLSQAYKTDYGISTSMTMEAQLLDDDFLSYAVEKMNFYDTMMSEPSTLFNIGGNVRWIAPEDRVCQIIGAFEDKVNTIMRSNRYHNDLLALPYHEKIPSWQKAKNMNFDTLTTIDVKIDGSASGHETSTGVAETVTRDGIIGIIVDRRACLTSRISTRTGVQNFPIENLTHTEYQEVTKYANLLDLNGIVFVMSDIVVSTT